MARKSNFKLKEFFQTSILIFEVWQILISLTGGGIVSFFVGLSDELPVWALTLIGFGVFVVLLLMLTLMSRQSDSDDGGRSTTGAHSPIQAAGPHSRQAGRDYNENTNYFLGQSAQDPAQLDIQTLLERVIADTRWNLERTGRSRVRLRRDFADMLFQHPKYLHMSDELRELFEKYYDRLKDQVEEGAKYPSSYVGHMFTKFFTSKAQAFLNHCIEHPVAIPSVYEERGIRTLGD